MISRLATKSYGERWKDLETFSLEKKSLKDVGGGRYDSTLKCVRGCHTKEQVLTFIVSSAGYAVMD